MPSPSRYYSSTAAKTTLSVAIDSASTSLQIATASGLPSQYPFTLILEKDTANEEIVNVTALVGTAYTIVRGQDGTTAKAHNIGAIIEHGVSARDFTESRAHEVASTAHNVTGDVVGTGGAQTLTSKTLTSPTINGGTITTAAHAGGTLTGTFTSTATITGGTITSATITGLSSAGMVDSSATPKNYVDNILGSAVAASTSAASAATSATAAATSASSASASATAAATSAASALTSQTAAATSATSAANSATAAATSAASALTSQTAAATSATSAEASATAAATSATSAANSATTAAASVATISGFATTASNSASAASTSASSAATSASSAATSASSAATSASSALTSASSASTSATNAAASDISAQNWATATSGPVAGGEYSAKYHAQAAATSATSAATSATSAAASVTAAATSASSAATSASSAATTYDNFDDRYLGNKSSAPAFDNDGNALLVGAIYWNDALNNMYVWSGSTWVQIATTSIYSAPTLGSTTIGSGATVTTINGLTLGSGLATADPSVALGLATKQYVDNIVTGLNFHAPVVAASTTNLGVTYSNGSSGVGATLTADTLRAFNTLDGQSVSVGNRVLIKDQSNQIQNGVYTLTENGSAGVTAWVLTRATDQDNSVVGEMANGDDFSVTGGTVNAGKSFVNSTVGTITIGTTNITYSTYYAGLPAQSSNSGKYLTTDGTTPSWGTISTPEVDPIPQILMLGGM